MTHSIHIHSGLSSRSLSRSLISRHIASYWLMFNHLFNNGIQGINAISKASFYSVLTNKCCTLSVILKNIFKSRSTIARNSFQKNFCSRIDILFKSGAPRRCIRVQILIRAQARTQNCRGLLAIKSGIAIIYNSLNTNRTRLANARNNHLFTSRSNPVGSGTHSASGMRDNAAFLCSTVLVDKFRKVRNTAKNTARRVDRKNNALYIIVCDDFIEGVCNGIVSIHSINCLPNIRAISQSAVNVQNGNAVANIDIILVVRLVRIFPNRVAKIGRTNVLDFRRHYCPLFRKDFQ